LSDRLLVVAILLTMDLYAEVKSTATITGVDKVTIIKLPASVDGGARVYAGTISGTVNMTNVSFFCIDLLHNLNYSYSYHDVQTTTSGVTYILNNYYPYKTRADQLADISQEATAIQLAIWSVRDSLNIDDCIPEVNPAVIISRAHAIKADADANAGTIKPWTTLKINIPSQAFFLGDTVKFKVEAYNEVGAPMVDVVVTLSTDEGTLSTTTVTTGADGVSQEITLVQGPNHSTIVTASGRVTIPEGTEYHATGFETTNQKLVIATPVIDIKTVRTGVNWWEKVNLELSKTSETVTVADGDEFSYVITVNNTSGVLATNVQVSDVLPNLLQFINATDVNYDTTTGVWNVGTVAPNSSKILTINVKADFGSFSSAMFNLGPAADYNVFVLNDIYQPSSDTQGKMAVGNDAFLQNYSVGDKLPINTNPATDNFVLLVGNKLTYKSGRVYGDISFRNFIDTTHWNLADGKIKMMTTDFPIDFTAASVYLNNLSNQLAALAPNGTTSFEYGCVALKGISTTENRFTVSGSDISMCNDFNINTPAGSTVIVNVTGDNITWKGGFALTGATNRDILVNFVDATNITVSNIRIPASILAPKTTLTFPTGEINGQVVAKNINGSGQFNNYKFNGKVTLERTITNCTEMLHVEQPMETGIYPRSMARVNSLHDITEVKKENSNIPVNMDLLQNYPNPFNPSTRIKFDIAETGFYTIRVFNVLGKEVEILVKGDYTPGSYNVSFDGNNLTSGIYICQLTGANVTITKKMTLVK